MSGSLGSKILTLEKLAKGSRISDRFNVKG